MNILCLLLGHRPPETADAVRTDETHAVVMARCTRCEKKYNAGSLRVPKARPALEGSTYVCACGARIGGGFPAMLEHARNCIRHDLQEVDEFYDGLRAVASAAVDGACATHGLAHPCEACAAEQPLRELLEEVRQCFTRDDDLPNDLLPRIDAALDGAPLPDQFQPTRSKP